MSMTLEASKNEITEEKGKIWPQYVTVMTALFAMFNSGLHFGWPSPSIPKILSDEYPLDVTVEEASYITIIGPAGDILGSIMYPAIVDTIGRKYTIILIAVPQIISMLMIYFSIHGIILLYAARFIGGLAEAACFTILPLYIGEIAEPKVRGTLGSYFSLSCVVGIVVSNLTGSYLSIQASALIYAILPVIFMMVFIWMPESPYYLIMKNKLEGAEKSLQTLRKKKCVQKELNQMIADVKRQMSEPGTYKDLYKIRTNRMACVIMFGLRIIQQFSGISAFTLYMQTLFEKSTDVIPKHLAATMVFCLQMFTNLVASFIVDKFGRKPLLIVSCGGGFLVLMLQGCFYFLADYTSVDVSQYTYLPLAGIICFVVIFTIGQGNVVNVMVGEMFSSSIKAKASSLMNIIFGITMLCSTKFFQYTTYQYSLSVSFFCFAFCQLLGTIFCVCLVPETSGKTLEEIQQGLKKRKTLK